MSKNVTDRSHDMGSINMSLNHTAQGTGNNFFKKPENLDLSNSVLTAENQRNSIQKVKDKYMNMISELENKFKTIIEEREG